MRKVRVAPGYSGVPILGKRINQGQLVTLTDEQYDALPLSVKAQLVTVSSGADQGDTPMPGLPPSPNPYEFSPAIYTDQLVEAALAEEAVAVTLVWDGSDYVPTRLKAVTNRPKTFIGPADPVSVPGVALASRDQWIPF